VTWPTGVPGAGARVAWPTGAPAAGLPGSPI
jgi:hypothetical protein